MVWAPGLTRLPSPCRSSASNRNRNRPNIPDYPLWRTRPVFNTPIRIDDLYVLNNETPHCHFVRCPPRAGQSQRDAAQHNRSPQCHRHHAWLLLKSRVFEFPPEAIAMRPARDRPGRLHHKSCSHKDFFQIGFIQGGCEAFVLDAYLACQFVLEQAECRASHDAEVRIRMTFTNPALVFLKRHVELPVQTVLNAPVVAHCLGKAASREIPAENVVADLVARLAVALRLAEGNSDGLQFRPARTIGQILRYRTDNVITSLFAAMSLLLRFIATCLGAGKVVLEVTRRRMP